MAASPVLAARCSAQLLTGPPAGSPEEAVRRVLAVQGQDPRGFRLAVRARTAGVTAADVDAALTERRTLVVSWLNRGTLHLVAAEDLRWLHDLTTPQLAATSRLRLEQEGVSPEQAERGIDTVVGEIAEHGPRTRPELRSALEAAGVPTAGQAVVHVLLAATVRHRIVRGPMRDGEHCLVLADDWLGQQQPLDREESLARLGRRYLAGHGPASARDLAMWAKLPLRDARAAFAATETVPAGDDLVDLADRTEPAPEPPRPRLLGNFDPILHGWTSRALVLGDRDSDVVTGGIFRSFAFADGRAVGLWRIEGGRVRIRPFAPLSQRMERALLVDARAVPAYLGLPPKDPVVEAHSAPFRPDPATRRVRAAEVRRVADPP